MIDPNRAYEAFGCSSRHHSCSPCKDLQNPTTLQKLWPARLCTLISALLSCLGRVWQLWRRLQNSAGALSP